VRGVVFDFAQIGVSPCGTGTATARAKVLTAKRKTLWLLGFTVSHQVSDVHRKKFLPRCVDEL